jgi:serine/threonine-protein kinase
MKVPSSHPPPPPVGETSPEAASAGDGLPRTIGSYTLFEQVGKGGMAQIYLARAETELGATRLAVVKAILPEFADDPRFAEMLIHEAKLAARLGHRRIVQVFDLGKHEQHLYIAMEYVEGFDLNSLLRRCTEHKVALPAPHALGIIADVLEGLDYAHRRTGEDEQSLGIVHRDVSPSNILISYEGEVKLCDFGIAHANDVVNEGANEALRGKAGYMSPEHACGEAIDARADVFAAGIILWELLAGRRLYKPKSEVPLVEQAKLAEIPPLPDKGVPRHAELEIIVRRALARDREERYPSAGAMLRDLEAYLAESGLLASRLKLGEWIASSFGTELIERRRASERSLPKSTPPPRSSERGDKPIPRSTLVRAHELPVSAGAMRAFKKELADGPRQPRQPGSLAGSVIDVALSSSGHALDRAAREMSAAAAFSGPLPAAVPTSKKRAAAVIAAAVTVATVLALVALARCFVQ